MENFTPIVTKINSETLKDLGDEQLIVNFRSSNEEKYLNELFKRYHNKVFDRLMVLSKHHQADAEDMLQSVFLVATKAIQNDTYKNEGNFEGWIMTIAYNTFVNKFRKVKKSRLDTMASFSPLNELSLSNQPSPDIKQPDQFLREIEIREAVENYINSLSSPSNRKILELKFLFDKKDEDIQIELSRLFPTMIPKNGDLIPLGSIKSQISKLRKKMIKELSFLKED